MEQETKPAGSARNWRTGAGYPDHKAAGGRWAWEFLRRNIDYRADWKRLNAVADELRGQYEEGARRYFGNSSQEGESTAIEPWMIIEMADLQDEPDERAAVYDPPRQAGESYNTWWVRAAGKGERHQLDSFLAKKWGLSRHLIAFWTAWTPQIAPRI